MCRHIRIGDYERGILLREGRFMDVLEPGEYWLIGSGVEVVVEAAESREEKCSAAVCAK